MHFLAYFTLKDTLNMLNISHKYEYYENHVRWIYLTTWRESEVCEKRLSDMNN